MTPDFAYRLGPALAIIAPCPVEGKPPVGGVMPRIKFDFDVVGNGDGRPFAGPQPNRKSPSPLGIGYQNHAAPRYVCGENI